MNHPNGYVSMIEDIPRGSNLYIVEVGNALEKDPMHQISMPSIYKINAAVILRSGFEPGQGLS